MTRPRAFIPSPKERAVYAFIVSYKRAHDGNSPSDREIGDACEISSTSTVDYYLKNLAGMGKIEFASNRKSRRVQVVGGAWTPPAGD